MPEAREEPTSTTQTLSTREARTALLARFRLKVLSGPDAGKTFESSSERTVIGSHASADLVLQGPAISRLHCEIVLSPDGPRLRDLGSKNGTLVDGVLVLEALLHRPCTLELGETTLRFEVGADRVEVPISAETRFGLLVGQAPTMRRALAEVERAARATTTVLIQGETGTGKGAAAESIHGGGPRAAGPFIVVDCGAIPAILIESELFGHERGAFTGATSTHVGAFEAADGGTLFLDEIGELELEQQPRLLRAIESRQIRRVGGTDYRTVDVRIIAATNRNLAAAVNKGAFRADLYYRLAVLTLAMPPLRERFEDLPLLVETFLQSFGAAERPEASVVREPSFLKRLALHEWPGNLRELRNHVERCLVLRSDVPLTALPTDGPPDRTWKTAVGQFERGYLLQLLEAHDDNVTAAAQAAGLSRVQFYRRLWRQGLR